MNIKNQLPMVRMSCPSRPSKALERLWYDKLKKEGFEDIENTTKRDRPLETWHRSKFGDLDPVLCEARRTYYDAALSLLHHHPFDKPIERAIWEMHANGLSKREIEAEIAKSDFKKKYKRESILNIIKRISIYIEYE